MTLSIVLITSNCYNVVKNLVNNVQDLQAELLVSDQNSTDGTREMLERFGARVFVTESKNLGRRKQELVKRAKGDWILILDSDERVSGELLQEIKAITHTPRRSHGFSAKRRISLPPSEVHGYQIPYQNYVFGRPVFWGGERYSKVRLFRRGYGRITEIPLHEEVIVNGKIGDLKGVIHHHSFRNPFQLFGKFTSYALTAAKLKKAKGEKVTLAKLFLYAPHMFWARFVNDKGYRDSWRGFVLALAFAYMEALTYWFLV